jgi:hypothetical protein
MARVPPPGLRARLDLSSLDANTVYPHPLRCRKGEKPASAGYDEGAVTIEVSSLAIGTPRGWDRRRDSGSGDLGTKVFPVKVTYSARTHYRTRTELEEDWVRVMNFHVDAFGEWQSGSEEPVRSPTVKSVPR